jgi:hypothetical protein
MVQSSSIAGVVVCNKMCIGLLISFGGANAVLNPVALHQKPFAATNWSVKNNFARPVEDHAKKGVVDLSPRVFAWIGVS